jgi:hypothetical protein
MAVAEAMARGYHHTQGWIKLDGQSLELTHIQLVEETFGFK